MNHRISEYEYKVAEVQKRISLVHGDREREILHRLLNGDSMRAIGKHMKLSSTTIFRGRYNILNQMMEKEEETAIAVSFYYLNNSK
ncbi:LuxR C-terminal-related transcriptional regulator [Lysinibacillus sp. G4S2]|nr:LuxR C-terminal-related transcriptional regulator [Lysinibacillus sp. G4S2]MDM5248618.1 LuxR C-terminal-related transcriptional regulator [Lysinibacillus sp. G4S2]